MTTFLRKDAMTSDASTGLFANPPTSLFTSTATSSFGQPLAGGTHQAGSFLNQTKQPPAFPSTQPKSSLFPGSTSDASSSWNPKMTTSITITNPTGATQSGGMFPSSSLFPSSSTPPVSGGSLFPTPTPAPAQQTTGGLFPSMSIPSTTSSLFPSANPTMASTMFPSNPNPGMSTPQKSPSLFPGINPNPISNQMTPPSFTNPAQNPNNSSLFPNPTSIVQPTNPAPGQTTNPSLMNPYLQHPISITNTLIPSVDQLNLFFSTKQSNFPNLNSKQLNLTNNPSLISQEANPFASVLAEWMGQLISNNKSKSTVELLNAPLKSLLPNAFKSLIQNQQRPKSCLQELPPELKVRFENPQSKKRSQSPPLDLNFAQCRHLSNFKSKNVLSKTPFENLYHQVSYNSKSNRQERQKSSAKYQPYSIPLKSIFQPITTNKLPSKQSQWNYHSSYNNYNPAQRSPEQIYPSQKQLPNSSQFLTNPSLRKLKNMSIASLKSLQNFKVYNRYGSIQFKSPTNILGLNFDQLITIEQDCIQIREPLIDESLGVGQNNVLLTFYNYSGFLAKIKGREQKQKRLLEAVKKKASKLKMVFMSFNTENGELVTKI